MSCIYIIKNIVNNKVYIGKTSCFNNRKKEHLRKLKRGGHVNNYLQSSYNKYGKDAFDFIILEECDNSLLNSREIYWIEKYNSTNNSYGYNLTYGGDGVNSIQEVRKKQSKAQDKNKKIVYGFTLKGDFYKVWNSIKECSREILTNTGDIRKTIRQEKYSCRGLILQNTSVFDNRLTPSEKINLRLRNPDGSFKSSMQFLN